VPIVVTVTTTRIAGKPTTKEEAREYARVAFVAEYALRIRRLVANVPTEPLSVFGSSLATDAPVPPLSSLPSSSPSPSASMGSGWFDG